MGRGLGVVSLGSLATLATLALASACSSVTDSSAAPPAKTPPSPTVRFVTDRGPVETLVFTDRFAVRIEGVPAGGEVVLEAKAYAAAGEGRGYVSSNTFVADAAGVVDTSEAAPKVGTYAGIDPDGIVWSMVETPLAEGLGARSSMFFHVTAAGVDLTATLKRTATSPDVSVTAVQEDGLYAEWFLPAGVTDSVPVVAFGGSEGGISGGEALAQRMASWGYPTLAIAYFGAPGLPAELDGVPLESFRKAWAWLDRQPQTRKGRSIVAGTSRGGELALLLGASFSNVVGVIAVTPSSHVWGGDSRTNAKAKAWTLAGQALPDIPATTFGPPPSVPGPRGEPAYRLRPTYEADLAAASPATLEAARIRVEDVKGPILMFGGDEDQVWPACSFIERATSKLAAHGYPDEGICYPGAGHLLAATGVPLTGSAFAESANGVLALGGTAAANAKSARDSDAKMRAFLAKFAQ